MGKAVGATVGSTGVISTLLTAGWVGMVLLIAIVAAMIGALCWVLADEGRAGRCALLISSWRGRTSSRIIPASRTGTDSPQHKRKGGAE